MAKKILIIEDNEDDLLIIKIYLKNAGYDNISHASDVDEGVLKAIQEKPDIVISDTLLPHGTGFDVCSKIREQSGDVRLKIIIMTGSVDAIDAVKARKSGADDYCAKTSDCAPLLEVLKKIS